MLEFQYPNGVLVFYLIGKCSSGAAFLLVWVITAELFPTNLRSQAVGLCSTVARIFGLVTPFVAQLAMYWTPLPMLVLGLPSLVSAGLVYLIPETKGRELPQAMTDAVKLQENPDLRELNHLNKDLEATNDLKPHDNFQEL
jgi:OCT family organic cation transporter-like MFS transporter 4/5